MVNWVDRQHLGVASGGLGLAWEFSNLLSSAIYTAIFVHPAEWRNPFFFAAGVAALTATLGGVLLKDHPEQAGHRAAFLG